MSYNPSIPIIISIVIPGAWLLNRSILIAYKKDLLKKGRTWLGERPILVPAISVFIVPIFISYLISNQIPDIVKFFIPLVTFMAGQFINRQDRKRYLERKQVENLHIIQRKLGINCENISKIKAIVNRELNSPPMEGFAERELRDLETINDEFFKLDMFFELIDENLITINDIWQYREISILINNFNDLLKEHRNLRSRCQKSDSTNKDFILLELNDKEILKFSNSYEKISNEIAAFFEDFINKTKKYRADRL